MKKFWQKNFAATDAMSVFIVKLIASISGVFYERMFLSVDWVPYLILRVGVYNVLFYGVILIGCKKFIEKLFLKFFGEPKTILHSIVRAGIILSIIQIPIYYVCVYFAGATIHQINYIVIFLIAENMIVGKVSEIVQKWLDANLAKKLKKTVK